MALITYIQKRGGLIVKRFIAELFTRVTADADTRVTADGDIRVST